MSKAKGATGGLAGLGAIGFGVYGIGQVHGFSDYSIFHSIKLNTQPIDP